MKILRRIGRKLRDDVIGAGSAQFGLPLGQRVANALHVRGSRGFDARDRIFNNDDGVRPCGQPGSGEKKNVGRRFCSLHVFPGNNRGEGLRDAELHECLFGARATRGSGQRASDTGVRKFLQDAPNLRLRLDSVRAQKKQIIFAAAEGLELRSTERAEIVAKDLAAGMTGIQENEIE